MNKPTSLIGAGLFRLWRALSQNKNIREMVYSFKNKNLFSNVDQHERMLADKVRVDTYHAAIHKYVTENDVVVDLGSGTGILSFFASQKNPKQIFAIDHGEIIELAKYLGKRNQINNITYVKSHSNDFNPPEKVDIIVHEQIGDFLLDEDMVKNICDLRDRILKPGGKILPGEFDLFFEPISLKANSRRPFFWEHVKHKVDFGQAKKWFAQNPDIISNRGIFQTLTPGQAKEFLCRPNPVFSFDLHRVIPGSMPKVFRFKREVERNGVLDGFCLFFKIKFDENIFINTSPFEEPTHWLSQLFRINPMYCKEGDVINITLEIDDQTKIDTWKIKHNCNQAVIF